MSLVLKQLVAAQKRSAPSDITFIQERNIDNPAMITCMVAVNDDGAILGFQVLLLATENNIYNVAVGWGVIGTHISPATARRGIGKALFAKTQENARVFGLKHIDASIEKGNSAGLAYYEAMGFKTYRISDEMISKAFPVF
jgi:ribosomal protein S18 acetylase RimI-like enzyme